MEEIPFERNTDVLISQGGRSLIILSKWKYKLLEDNNVVSGEKLAASHIVFTLLLLIYLWDIVISLYLSS